MRGPTGFSVTTTPGGLRTQERVTRPVIPTVEEIRALARSRAPAAIQRLRKIAAGSDPKLAASARESLRLRRAQCPELFPEGT